MNRNIIIDTDAYKVMKNLTVHQDLTKQYSYGEARKGGKYPYVSWFGLQMIVQDHLLQKVDNAMIEEAEEQAYMTFGTTKYFDRKTWEKIRDLGYFPMKIMSAPEGLRIGEGNVLFTSESSDEFEWFAKTVQHFEGLLMHSWWNRPLLQ